MGYLDPIVLELVRTNKFSSLARGTGSLPLKSVSFLIIIQSQICIADLI
jgi:hypothetical protein